MRRFLLSMLVVALAVNLAAGLNSMSANLALLRKLYNAQRHALPLHQRNQVVNFPVNNDDRRNLNVPALCFMLTAMPSLYGGVVLDLEKWAELSNRLESNVLEEGRNAQRNTRT
ncbi:hypothetical protein BVRB_024030 [Beta vulgaris subsp. vulgaris]|uniref:Uncharacterized protein n=1 Tax=Beta vulgaris subsp. vulgaris TaxID=3555 RepID=A0A0J8B2V0_BETVV|nr:hypothetical protein BVRB_024030 [Beta vulgaris subsp. vulgaris]